MLGIDDADSLKRLLLGLKDMARKAKGDALGERLKPKRALLAVVEKKPEDEPAELDEDDDEEKPASEVSEAKALLKRLGLVK